MSYFKAKKGYVYIAVGVMAALFCLATTSFVLAESKSSNARSSSHSSKSIKSSVLNVVQKKTNNNLYNFFTKIPPIATVPLSCDPGYIEVPGNPQFNTKNFCVMQYEAKCLISNEQVVPNNLSASGGYDDMVRSCLKNNGRVLSTPKGRPIVNVTQETARAYCESAGARLIANEEWMTIARNAEEIPENWLFGIVDFAALKHGLSYGKLQDGTTEYAGSEFQRTLKLSNGNKIWDLSGNAPEIVDARCLSGDGFGFYRPTNFEVVWSVLGEYGYERTASGPYYNGTLHEYIHGGMYYGCSSSGNIFLRGGGTLSVSAGQQFSYPGAFSLHLGYVDGIHDVSDSVSFRCVKPLR